MNSLITLVQTHSSELMLIQSGRREIQTRFPDPDRTPGKLLEIGADACQSDSDSHLLGPGCTLSANAKLVRKGKIKPSGQQDIILSLAGGRISDVNIPK